MLAEWSAADVVDAIDVDALGACPMCLFDLAWELRHGRIPNRQLVNRTADWVWLEIEDSLRRAIVQARMRELPHAEEALSDLEANGSRGVLVREIVERLALALSEEMSN